MTTGIQISTLNRDLLLELGRIMQRDRPEVWDKFPSYNEIIGYAMRTLSQLMGEPASLDHLRSE